MTRYIRFPVADGGSVLVEVDDDEVGPAEGVQKAGLVDKAKGLKDVVAEAQRVLDHAIQDVVKTTAEALITSVRSLAETPDCVEATFGLKATGEAGNFAIAKLGGELNISVKLTWKPSATTEK